MNPAVRTAQLEEAQRQPLLMIASGAPLGECLDALTDAAGRLAPGVRACVLLANEDRNAMPQGYSAHFPRLLPLRSRGCRLARR
ncbi:hypothetical protein [Comamonas antarctica]|uniref:hypothetical protein n=1 Tax=Comamonas antarctica TaxID=2743470 RepID=UPI0028EB423E|nr:hypothetical protein [Comamonas antarctica]